MRDYFSLSVWKIIVLHIGTGGLMDKFHLFLFSFLFPLTVFAAGLEVGQSVSNLCWQDLNEKQVCLDDARGTIRVLVYNTGWCHTCNEEMAKFPAAIKPYEGKPVTFYSLSAQGFKNGDLPTTEFLKEWQKKHNIPFIVAASPKDAGKLFWDPPYFIPRVAIIDQSGKLANKNMETMEAVFAEINRLLGSDE